MFLLPLVPSPPPPPPLIIQGAMSVASGSTRKPPNCGALPVSRHALTPLPLTTTWAGHARCSLLYTAVYAAQGGGGLRSNALPVARMYVLCVYAL